MKNGKGLRKKHSGGYAIETRDFSVVEDSPEALAIISQLAHNAGKHAASEAKAMGLPQVFATDQYIISRSPNGQEEIISSAAEEGIKAGSYFVDSPVMLLTPYAK